MEPDITVRDTGTDIHLWNKPRETKGREKRGRGGWGGVGVGSGEWEREEKRTKSHNKKCQQLTRQP